MLQGVAKDGEMGKNAINRTGGTSRRSGNPPVVSFSDEFSPKTDPPEVLDESGLIERMAGKGFVDARTNQARYFLRRIGYAHASDYFRSFSGGARPGLMAIHQAILFDRRMQSEIMKGIGLFELQFRAQYAYLMSAEGGAFAHRDPSNYKDREHFLSFLSDYEREVNRQLANRNGKILHFVETYGDAPIWQAVEIMSFGTLSKLYRNTRSRSVRIGVADSFGIRYEILTSWMRTISFVRNRCAHFGKLFGTRLVAAPKGIPDVQLRNTHPFYVVLMLEKLLSTDDEFSDDPSLMYSLDLARNIAGIIGTTPLEVRSRLVPANWRSLMTRRDIVGTDFELVPADSGSDPMRL